MNLKNATITGFVTRPNADGMCAHCGMGIKHCVVVIDPETKKEVTIGTTCAVRVGVDSSMIRSRETHAQRKEREAQQKARDEAYAERMAPILEARKAKRSERARLLSSTVETMRGWESPFFTSIADQLESRQSLSPRQATAVCQAFSATGRKNKKNSAEWDARMDLLCDA